MRPGDDAMNQRQSLVFDQEDQSLLASSRSHLGIVPRKADWQ